MQLSKQDKLAFEERGFLYLPGVVPKNLVNAAKEGILGELERLQMRVGGKWQQKKFEGTPSFQLTAKLSQSFKHHETFSQLLSPNLVGAIAELAGGAVATEKAHPTVLFTPPQKGPWRMPYLGWHVDIARHADGSLPGVQVFILVDQVAPQGGGTVVLAGSHKLHELIKGHGKGALQILREDPYFSDLFSPTHEDWARYFQPHPIAHLNLQMIEMHGCAGDAFLMDMRILHAPAPNASKNARLMLTHRFLTSSHKNPPR